MSIVSILLGVAKLLGLVDALKQAIHDHEMKQQGREAQKADDQAATIKDARDAAKTETQVARDSDAQLDDELRPFSRPKS